MIACKKSLLAILKIESAILLHLSLRRQQENRTPAKNKTVEDHIIGENAITVLNTREYMRAAPPDIVAHCNGGACAALGRGKKSEYMSNTLANDNLRLNLDGTGLARAAAPTAADAARGVMSAKPNRGRTRM